TGVRMEIEGELITLAATARYRLAVRELKWEPAQPGLQAVAMIPGRTLADIAKALGGTGAEVEIALSSGGTGEGMIGFSSAGRRTTTRLLDPERSEEHTSELQSRENLVCRLLLEKKN